MRAIIPVAGVGTRLRPHTHTLPKVLLNVAGKPILGHILDKLIEDGITTATIIVGYYGELVEEYIRASYPTLNAEFVEQADRQGLGHSIYLGKDSLGDEPILIVLGDTIFDVDLTQVLNSEYSSIGVREVEDPRRFGVVEMSGEFIGHLIEKPEVPPSNMIIVGPYYIKNPRLLAECLTDLVEGDQRTRGEYQLTDALQMMIDRGEKFTTFNVEGWFDCGKPETLLETNRVILARKPKSREIPGVIMRQPVFIADDAQIENSIIGPDATIAGGAMVRNSIISDSIINARANVEGAVLSGALIGEEAIVRRTQRNINIGAHSEVDL